MAFVACIKIESSYENVLVRELSGSSRSFYDLLIDLLDRRASQQGFLSSRKNAVSPIVCRTSATSIPSAAPILERNPSCNQPWLFRGLHHFPEGDRDEEEPAVLNACDVYCTTIKSCLSSVRATQWKKDGSG